jgi:aspartate/methionine/tyrosine aminotransferase
MVGITPAYQSSYEIPRSVGAQVTLVPLREDRGWALDTDELAAALTARTRLIYINFPHNPTGAVLSAAGQQRVVELADSCGAYLFSDEVYRGLEVDPADRLPGLVDEFMRHRADAVRWIRPQGGSIGFPELLIDMPVGAFCERLVREHGVLLIPGGRFEVGTNHFRIGLGRASLPAGLATLGSFMDEPGGMDELGGAAGTGAVP